jgi:malonyl-CoA decarboxylase
MSGSSFLADLLETVSDRGRALLRRGDPNGPSGPGGPDALIDLCEALLSGRGEATGLAIARDILERYAELDQAERLSFFQALATRFGADTERFQEALAAWQSDPSDDRAAALHFASEPRRQEVFRRLNRAPGGMEALVGMRTDILGLLGDHPELESTDRDFHHLFSSWFNRGFLVLRRIDWSTPAIILDKLIRYEAVHEIHDWDDLRSRTDPPDRRCYAFFHPALANEPLIFVEVALTRDVSHAIGPILAGDRTPLRAAEATTAVFYSISNCQHGLQGVSFGNFLIKQVVDDLARDLPEIETFVTLSPAPGFAAWLRSPADDGTEGLLDADRRTVLERLDEPGSLRDPATVEALQPHLLRLAAYYFLIAKNTRGEPLDPVARFHLGNGARLDRLNWPADTSEKGIAQGAGLMVNYRYEQKHVERNHEAYANHGEIAAAVAVSRHLKVPSASEERVKA